MLCPEQGSCLWWRDWENKQHLVSTAFQPQSCGKGRGQQLPCCPASGASPTLCPTCTQSHCCRAAIKRQETSATMLCPCRPPASTHRCCQALAKPGQTTHAVLCSETAPSVYRRAAQPQSRTWPGITRTQLSLSPFAASALLPFRQNCWRRQTRLQFSDWSCWRSLNPVLQGRKGRSQLTTTLPLRQKSAFFFPRRILLQRSTVLIYLANTEVRLLQAYFGLLPLQSVKEWLKQAAYKSSVGNMEQRQILVCIRGR